MINVDITVIAEEPKINPHVNEMKLIIAESLDIDPRKVCVKATTNERIGFIGRGEGMAAMAVVSIKLPEA